MKALILAAVLGICSASVAGVVGEARNIKGGKVEMFDEPSMCNDSTKKITTKNQAGELIAEGCWKALDENMILVFWPAVGMRVYHKSEFSKKGWL